MQNHLVGLFFLTFIVLVSCGGNPSEEIQSAVDTEYVEDDSVFVPEIETAAVPKKLKLRSGFEQVNLKEIELEPIDNKFWYHIVFQLDEHYSLAVAQPSEDNFEGVRLQLIKQKKNGQHKVVNESSPGYDSAMLYPTFFKSDEGEYIILANMGVQDSWGNKVFSLIKNQIDDLGYIDMATTKRREFPDENGNMSSAANIAEVTKITNVSGELRFDFEGDKLLLFKDDSGNHDIKFQSGDYYYTYDGKNFELNKKDA